MAHAYALYGSAAIASVAPTRCFSAFPAAAAAAATATATAIGAAAAAAVAAAAAAAAAAAVDAVASTGHGASGVVN